MEHTSAWGGPFEFQLAAANWSAEEGPAGDAQAWAAPAVDHPLEYASIIDIFGSSCSLQPYAAPTSSSVAGQQPLVEYNYYNYNAAAAQCDRPVGRATSQPDQLFEQQMETHMTNPMGLFKKREDELDKAYDAHFLKQKMHRYPPSIRALSDHGLYTVPRVVAIGPYHHFDGDHLKEAEKVKHVAAQHCMMKSGVEVEDLYQEVISAAKKHNASGLYDKDVMEGMGDEDQLFLPMLFYDACFLVMYMVKKSGTKCDPTLYDFFECNENHIAHDIMLLENQIPLPVVDAVLMKLCMPGREPMEIKKRFISRCKDGCLQDRVGDDGRPHIDWDKGYNAPHLLGLIRFYVVGKSSCCRERRVSDSDLEKIKSIPISAGAIELAEIGISLTASKTTNEIPADMGIGTKWPLCFLRKLSIAPLCLNDLHASMLVNMAALELCVTADFFADAAKREDSAVCSYLRLLCMLVHREEDVHELRTNGILQGAGVTNSKTLDFFTNLQSLPQGPSYGSVMIEIEGFKMNNWWWLWLYKLVYRYRNFIIGFVAAAGALASILQLFKGGN